MSTTIILMCSWFVLLCCIILIAKNYRTYEMRRIILEAICCYKLYCIKEDYKAQYDVDYDDIEDYGRTLWRLWDWGYTRILPKEQFEIVQPFIGKSQYEYMMFTSTDEEEE